MDNKQHYLPRGRHLGRRVRRHLGDSTRPLLLLSVVPVAGLLAVMNIANKANVTIPFAEGAVVGLLTGLIRGVISGALGAAAGPAMLEFYRTIPSVEPQGLAQMEAMYGNPVAAFLQSCCLFTVVGPAFDAIGGLIGSAIFKKGPGGVPQPQAY